MGLYRVFAFERIPDDEIGKAGFNVGVEPTLVREVEIIRRNEIETKQKGVPYKSFIQSSDICDFNNT